MNSLCKNFTILIFFVIPFSSCKKSDSDNNKNTITTGWTEVKKSTDSKVYYVSSSSGSDSNDGLSPDAPLKTLTAGFNLLRDGYPDWLLLKTGDTWREAFPNWNEGPSGRSSDEPVLVSSYGTGARPVIKANGDTPPICKVNNEEKKHIYFIGLDFYNSQRDPSSPDYDATSMTNMDAVFWLDESDDLLFEDCVFRFFAFGLVVEKNTSPNRQPIKNFRLRRCVITDNYARNNEMSTGYFFWGVEHLLVEENIFDHNGWNVPAGGNPTMFNHNTYTVECNDVKYKGNLLLRASSLDAKFRSDHTDGSVGIVIENNFLFESELGISIGGNTPTIPLRFRDVEIKNNVFLQIDRENPTQRELGWALEGQDLNNAKITDNLFIDQPLHEGNNYAIQLSSISNKDVLVQNNTMYHLTSFNMEIIVKDESQWSNVQIKDNILQSAGLNAILVAHTGSFNKVSFQGNTYNSSLTNWASIGGNNMNYNTWLTQSKETGSKAERLTYSQPEHTLESYQQSLTGGGLDEFMAQIRLQSKNNWRKEYTAAAVNDYFRTGFNLPALGN